MLSNDSAEPLPSASKAAAAGGPAVLDPRSPIEVAPPGTPPPPDPGASDRPPGVTDPDLYV